MICAANPAVRDRWLLPVLMERLPAESLETLESRLQGSYWETAVRESLISDDDILAAVSSRLKMEVADASTASREARDAVPESLARRFSILPLSISDSTLEIATADPLDIDCEKTLAFATSRRVLMSLCSPARIRERIDEIYAPIGRADHASGQIEAARSSKVSQQINSDDTATDNDAERPVIRLVDQIVADGIAQGASDIHLEAGETGIAVRYRIDGILKDIDILPKAVGVTLVSRIKIMSQMV